MGLSPRPSTQAKSSRYGGSSPGQINSISSGSLPPSAATAVLASRAETPIRRAPVTSFKSAQRPVSSRESSQCASRPGSSALPSVASAVTTSLSVGALICCADGGACAFVPPPKGEGGHEAAGWGRDSGNGPPPGGRRPPPSPCGGGIGSERGAGQISATVSDRSPT